jgi:hypothetical protein
MSHAFKLSSILCAATVMACGGGESSPSVTVRDSAGIRIVEHPVGFSAPSWVLSDAPRVTIGDATGDSTALLYQVEGAHRLSDGRIVVANRSSHELRYYDSSGTHLYSRGREGEGPGEFGYIAWTTRCGTDSLYVYDIRTVRLSVFDGDGTFARSTMVVMPNGRGPYSVGTCASDGTFLFAGWHTPSLSEGPSRPPRPLALVNSEGTVVRELGEFPGGERYQLGRSGMPRPLGKELSHAMGEDRFYVGTADSYEIAVHARSGDLEMIIRKDRADLAITDADLDRFITASVSQAPDDNARRSWERQYREMEWPATFPAYAGFLIDQDGNLWVRDYLRPGDTRSAWCVFGLDGTQIAQVEMPANLEVFEVGEDYVLGKWRDDLDVEHVGLYRLLKPGGERPGS